MDPNRPVPDGKEGPKRNPWGTALGAGSELAVSSLAGFFLGRWLDGKFGTSPWLLLAGILLGISVGLYQLIRATRIGGDGRP